MGTLVGYVFLCSVLLLNVAVVKGLGEVSRSRTQIVTDFGGERVVGSWDDAPTIVDDAISCKDEKGNAVEW